MEVKLFAKEQRAKQNFWMKPVESFDCGVEAEVNAWLASNPNITVKEIKQSLRATKRSLCRYLMVETTAAHSSLRQQKSPVIIPILRPAS